MTSPAAQVAQVAHRARRARLACGALALLVALGCGRGDDAARTTSPDSAANAPIEAAGRWIVEPPRLEIGDVALLTLLVATQSGEHALPYVPPASPAFDVVSLQSFAPETRAGRAVQRTELRVRPRMPGPNEWPASEVTIVSASGERHTLQIPARRIEIVSHLGSAGLERRPEPPRFRAAPTAPQSGLALDPGLTFGVGFAAGGLAAVALLAARRRRSARIGRADAAAAEASRGTHSAASPFVQQLDQARAIAARDPQRAAVLTSDLLRRYLAARFHVATRARTSPELASGPKPFAARSRWEGFVALLERLDALRFAPAERVDPRELDALLSEVEAIVREGGTIHGAA